MLKIAPNQANDTNIIKGFWRAYDRADGLNLASMRDLFGVWTNMNDGERKAAIKGIETRGTDIKRQQMLTYGGN